MGLFNSKKPATPPTPPAWTPPPGLPRLRLDALVEVAGVDHYFSAIIDTIRDVTGREVGKAEYQVLDALLVAEPDNPHDPRAIAVTVAGRKLGHVPRALTRSFHEAMDAEGTDQAVCRVVVGLGNEGVTAMLGGDEE